MDLRDTEKVYSSVKTGEQFALRDGEYLALVERSALAGTNYSGIDLLSMDSGEYEAHILQDVFLGNTTVIRFTVQDGLPDRELKFYLRTVDPADNE